MDYFFSHIIYIIIGGLIIAAIAGIWAFFAAKWAVEVDEEKEAAEEQGVPAEGCQKDCNGCAGCSLFNSCGRRKDGTPVLKVIEGGADQGK